MAGKLELEQREPQECLLPWGRRCDPPAPRLGCGMQGAAPPCFGSASEQDFTSRTGHPSATGVPGNAKHVLNHGTARQLWISFFFKERPRSVDLTVSLAQTLARQMGAFPTASPEQDSIPTPASLG